MHETTKTWHPWIGQSILVNIQYHDIPIPFLPTRGMHGLVLEENQTELFVFQIQPNQTVEVVL
jgi:hypothetical protein